MLMMLKIIKKRYYFILLIVVTTAISPDVSVLKQNLKVYFTTFVADFSYSNSDGLLYSGKLSYQYPDKVHIKFSDGKVIASDGKFLWVYDPSTLLCAKQVLDPEKQEGLFDLLNSGFTFEQQNNRYIFTRDNGFYREIVVDVENGLFTYIRLITKDNKIMNFSFHNVQTDVGIRAGLFNYKPPTDAQLVENPLNKYSIYIK